MFLTMGLSASPAMAADDSALCDGLRRRDPNAMGRLYDNFGRVVYSVIYRIVEDTGVAEDLVQETFLRVWNQAHAFDPARGSMAAWLLTVARNRAIDWKRSVAAKPDRTTWGAFDEDRPDRLVDLEKSVIDSDQVRCVRRAMEKLNQKQRSVIDLAYFEGLTQSEMAERMSEPLGTVKTWVRTALKILREELSAA